jgi:hypothetical protein
MWGKRFAVTTRPLKQWSMLLASRSIMRLTLVIRRPLGPLFPKDRTFERPIAMMPRHSGRRGRPIASYRRPACLKANRDQLCRVGVHQSYGRPCEAKHGEQYLYFVRRIRTRSGGRRPRARVCEAMRAPSCELMQKSYVTNARYAGRRSRQFPTGLAPTPLFPYDRTAALLQRRVADFERDRARLNQRARYEAKL